MRASCPSPSAACTRLDADWSSGGGIYVHFPFCVHRCFYCDFNVFTPPRVPHRRYTDAVLSELVGRSDLLEGPARSLYIGGGTPSLWDPREVQRLIDAAAQRPGLRADAEVTLEANPSDITRERLVDYRTAGVNRVSIGVQATDDKILKAADRRHSALTARRAVEFALDAGFQSVTLDLIFGLPTQTQGQWRETLDEVLRWDVPHLSIYALTVEERTPLAKMVSDNRVRLPHEDAQADMMFLTRDVLMSAGYEHYEVSSYARQGHRAVHNSGYWELRPYLGLGAGAHGYADGRRWTNLRRVGPYVSACMESGDPTADSELIDDDTLALERVMTGLRRLVEGVDLAPVWDRYQATVVQQVSQGYLHLDGTRARLTERGLRFMNAVLLAFVPA